MKFKYTSRKQGAHELVLGFANYVDESFSVPIDILANQSQVTIDSSQVKGINSIGTRHLTEWFWGVNSKYPTLKVTIAKLTPALARQFLSIGRFVPPNIGISSVLVPYFCDTCNLEDGNTLVSTEMIKGRDLATYRPTPPTCAKCKGVMELDIIPQKYFSLLLR